MKQREKKRKKEKKNTHTNGTKILKILIYLIVWLLMDRNDTSMLRCTYNTTNLRQITCGSDMIQTQCTKPYVWIIQDPYRVTKPSQSVLCELISWRASLSLLSILATVCISLSRFTASFVYTIHTAHTAIMLPNKKPTVDNCYKAHKSHHWQMQQIVTLPHNLTT